MLLNHPGKLKDDTKDPKLIANLVKDGNFGMPYLPEKIYAELRRLSMFRDQLNPISASIPESVASPIPDMASMFSAYGISMHF